MDIFQPRNLNPYVKAVIDQLQFGNYKLEIVGSYSLQSQQNTGDIDIDSFITGRKESKYINDEFKNVINRIDRSEDIYFIELKIQYKDGEKTKFDPSQIEKLVIPKDKIDNIEYVKIDVIASLDGVFEEISINYWFSKNVTDIIKDIKEGVKELSNEGSYFKIVKRLFSISRLINDKPKALIISKYLNTKTGEEYKVLSNLNAIKELLYYYDDDKTKKKARINLLNIDIKPDLKVIEPLIKKIQKKIDDDALLFLKGIE